MAKLVLYIFRGGELDEVYEGIAAIKKIIKKYENSSKRSIKKVGGDSEKV